MDGKRKDNKDMVGGRWTKMGAQVKFLSLVIFAPSGRVRGMRQVKQVQF